MWRRAGELGMTIAGVLLLTFLFMHWLPGDPAELYAGEEASAEEVEAMRERLGLDQPLPVQLSRYVGTLLQGDLGTSLRSGKPVRDELAARFPVTAQLAGLATAVAVLVAIPAGILGAVRPRFLATRIVDACGLLILATPIYWLGILLILTFAVAWRVLPPGGSDSLIHLVLPALALGAHTGAATARILKAALEDTMTRPYLKTALGKGATESRTVWVHALPNAGVPVITFLGMETGRLMGGAVLTETVFGVNGLGRFLVTSISFRDYPCVLGVVLVMAVGVTLANLIADALCACLNPQGRAG